MYQYPNLGDTRNYTPEERDRLAREAYEGGPVEKARLVESTLRLVILRARRFAFAYFLREHDFEDAVHAGVEGCYEAFARFNPDKGKWWTFARWDVDKSIINFCKDKHVTCYNPEFLPEELMEDYEVWGEMERELRNEEIGKLLAELPEADRRLLELRVLGDDALTLRELGDAIDRTYERARQKVNDVLKKLKPKVEHLR